MHECRVCAQRNDFVAFVSAAPIRAFSARSVTFDERQFLTAKRGVKNARPMASWGAPARLAKVRTDSLLRSVGGSPLPKSSHRNRHNPIAGPQLRKRTVDHHTNGNPTSRLDCLLRMIHTRRTPTSLIVKPIHPRVFRSQYAKTLQPLMPPSPRGNATELPSDPETQQGCIFIRCLINLSSAADENVLDILKFGSVTVISVCCVSKALYATFSPLIY
jgi:hypothetical protein